VRIADRWITAFPLRVKRSHPNYPNARVSTFDPVSATGPTSSPDVSFVRSLVLQQKSPKSYIASKSIPTIMQYCLRTQHCLKPCVLHNNLRFWQTRRQQYNSTSSISGQTESHKLNTQTHYLQNCVRESEPPVVIMHQSNGLWRSSLRPTSCLMAVTTHTILFKSTIVHRTT
jgi:hypothetical protein